MVVQVNRFEAKLLSIVYSFFEGQAVGLAQSKLLQPLDRPACLGHDAVVLVQQALAKGTTAWLARAGGWQVDRFLRNELSVHGRVWQRTPPENLGLEFSAASLEFLIWMTSEDLMASNARWTPADPSSLTVGDQILLFLALSSQRHLGPGSLWFSDPLFAQNPLVSLFYPDGIAVHAHEMPIEMTPWMQGPGSIVLECVQSKLALRWVLIERAKSQIGDPDRMLKLGLMQDKVLRSLASAIDRTGRRDLSRFILATMAELATTSSDAQHWIRRLDVSHMRLADRTKIYSAASTFLAFAQQLRKWADQCRSIGYFDEGYGAAQLFLSDWERYDGENVTSRALAISGPGNPQQALPP